MNFGFLTAVKGVFHDLHEQERVVISGRDFSRRRVLVPKLPSLEVHQRFNVDGGDVQVAGVLLVERRHGFSERHVQCRVVAHVEHGWVGGVSSLSRVPGGQGANEVLLKFGAVVHHLERLLDGVVA